MAKKKPVSAAKKKPSASSKKPKPADTVFQFKITLLGTEPPIWRRIQVPDGTLDELHQHIQTSMGWTNSHMHQFKIGTQLYGNPALMEENFDDLDCGDSTATRLTDLLPKTRKRFRMLYEYDFGDSWEHEVLFEGQPEAEAGRQYPICLEGERACPPEDCGGVWGYAELLKAIGDKKHEQYEEMLEWVGGRFDPEKFDAAAATKRMREGLADWSDEDGMDMG